jgi:hypothetical protein
LNCGNCKKELSQDFGNRLKISKFLKISQNFLIRFNTCLPSLGKL